MIKALDAVSGKLLWEHRSKAAPLTLTVTSNQVFFHNGQRLVALARDDGEVLWEAKEVRAGATPRKVGPLDVHEVDELVLEVDFGPERNIRDRAVWADPLLTRK